MQTIALSETRPGEKYVYTWNATASASMTQTARRTASWRAAGIMYPVSTFAAGRRRISASPTKDGNDGMKSLRVHASHALNELGLDGVVSPARSLRFSQISPLLLADNPQHLPGRLGDRRMVPRISTASSALNHLSISSCGGIAIVRVSTEARRQARIRASMATIQVVVKMPDPELVAHLASSAAIAFMWKRARRRYHADGHWHRSGHHCDAELFHKGAAHWSAPRR